ncbi:MAG: LacI family DNA-binding transcriptional regulator [Sumerlaeia bacterium]
MTTKDSSENNSQHPGAKGRKRNVTVKEIAKRAGVSVSTVSRVMSGADTAIPISEQTRKKVMEVCEELKFLPDVNYLRLKERRSYSIGFLIPRMNPEKGIPFQFDENVGLFLSAFEHHLSLNRFGILIQGVDAEYIKGLEHLRILRNNTVDGMVVWDAFSSPAPVHELNQEIRPFICVAFPYEGAKNFIIPDNFQGAYDLASHLISLGHKEIAYVSGGMGELVDRLREDGFRRALNEHGLTIRVYDGHYTFKGGYSCAEQIMADNANITAILAANDLMAIGAMEYARLAGISMPQDLAIAGFDGSSHSSVVLPRLTTGRLPWEEMGRLAAEHLVNMIENEDKDPVQLTLPIEIITRESTLGSSKK